MFLLDTNVLSELRRYDRANPKVVAWARGVETDHLFLSVVTIVELRTGALLAERRDKAQGAMLRSWIDGEVIPAIAGRILPVDMAVAIRCAHLHVPDPQSAYDALIAATALVHDLKVVTRNVSDFAPMGVDLVNPWE